LHNLIGRWRCRLHSTPPIKLGDGGKVELAMPSIDSPSSFNERTAMVGVKQALYRTDDGMTYSELFQLKPSSSSLRSASFRHCSKHDVKYTSPARLSATTVIQPNLSNISSRVTRYDSPYCAWCFENTSTLQSYRQVMSVHQPRSPPTATRCRSDEIDAVDGFFRHRCQRQQSANGRFGQSDIEDNKSNEDVWLDTLADQPHEGLPTPVSRQVPVAPVDVRVDGDDVNASSATSPDIVISTAAQQRDLHAA
jgi:hypothetical protein